LEAPEVERSLAFCAGSRQTAHMPVARRKPTQERSRRTVERIIDAAAVVLAEHGYDAASTNRIAAEAGVSPGTLYGYFADKDEIVGAVIERVVDGFGAAVAPALRAAAGQPAAESSRLLLGAVLAEVEARRDLVAAFIDRVPAERYAPRVDALRDRVSDVVVHLLTAEAPEASQHQIDLAAWMAVRTVEHLMVRYALSRPPIEREAFIDALADMVVGLASTGSPAP
jgi:AcrR family transcriptional regulator